MSDTTGNALALPTETPVTATQPERSADGRFTPGFVGNPKGRTRGSRNRATEAMESLIDGEAEAIGSKLIQLALSGDSTALRLCVERTIPRLKSKPMKLELPQLNTPTDVANAISTVIDAAANGEIDTDQARTLTTVLDARRKSFETIELEERLTLIEKKVSRDRRAI